MPGFLILLEKVFVVISLFLSTSALIPILVETEESAIAAADPYTPILFMGVYAVTGVLIFQHWKNFLWIARKDIWLWLLMGIAIASIAWTIAPDITPRRSLLLLGTSLFGAYMAVRYSIRQQLQLLGWAFALLIGLSFVFAIALPNYGLMTFQEGGIHAGAWRGVFSHKNLLGRSMVLSSMIFMFIIASKSVTPKYRWLPWLGYTLSFALIVLSSSKTAIVSFFMLGIIFQLYRSWRLNYSRLIPFAIAFILIFGTTITLIIDNLPLITSAVGRDLTLTGRTDIWMAMLDKISERPFLGYGLNGFWRDWDNEATAFMWRILGWECPYGHNGFMDLFAELGIFGLVSFMISYGTTFFRSISWLRKTKSAEGIWSAMYLTFLLIYNISESTLLTNNSIFWILYTSATFSIFAEYERLQDEQYMNAVYEAQLMELEIFNEQNLN
ncbi:O-antigen ligase family protein [Calothrix sp. PCC 6303]|uniref:O-antigen ligase family protein n=1 Tax=Calothrix sp. PCC 6303 TaxID=1170562 RepID=UPI0002A045E5|nr:O-antigen ligase [Calothrix sp. PCC 6303]AFZ03444.1 O-antigen polymerase [Calothrix sp. PCC 6303]